MNTTEEDKTCSKSSCCFNFSKVDGILKEHKYQKSHLIAILQAVQAEYNYVPEEVMTYIGTKIEGLSPATVYGVATFYSQFSLNPKGQYVIRICDGTACHVRGSMPVYNAVIQKLKLQDGTFTTQDGLFTLETVSCLGACGLAPVMMINEKVYPQMTSDAVGTILDTLTAREN